MSTSTTNILDLNENCMESIMTYLPLVDKITLTRAASQFESCLVRFLRKDKFPINELLKRFSTEESENIFKEFGFDIKRIYLDESERNQTLHSLVIKYCTSLKEINWSCGGRVDPAVCKQFVTNSNHLQTLTLHDSNNYDSDILFDIVFEDISKLTRLTTLSLECSNITGEHLSKLRNLKHLNLRRCFNLKSQYFIEICRSTKLLTLNICGLSSLNNKAIEILVETQTELRKIVMGFDYDYDATNIAMIAQLPNLKEIVFLGCTTKSLVEYLTALNVHKDNSLESIFATDIYMREPYSRYSPNHEVDFDEIHGKILKLHKLKQLCFPVSYFANSDFLEALPKACPDLEVLNIGGSDINANDILQVTRRLKNLTHLSASIYTCRNSKLYQDLVEVIKERRTWPLEWYSYYNDQSLFLESMEYKSKKKYVQVLRNSFGAANYSLSNKKYKTPSLDFDESSAKCTLREDSDLLALPDKILQKITTLLDPVDQVKLLLIHDRFHSIVPDSLKDAKINIRELSRVLTFAETEEILDVCYKYMDKVYFIYKDGVKPVEYCEVLNSYRDGFVEIDVDSEPENFMDMATFLFSS